MIRVLDSFIADKIAAGEVIERPVSAAKELIENSIDASASSVIVEIRGGGSSYMRITDDGSGIASDEIETAFLRHATSKISSAADLDNIRSLGFRGEALASICAVSRLTIVSKTSEEQSGVKLIIHAGKIVSREKVGTNKGTTIILEDLFYNVPARRKFLKSDAREASAIIELVQHYAICYPNIRFMMINNGETLFSTSGNGDSLAVIQALYPDRNHSSLIKVSGEGVEGYISGPGVTLNNKKSQLFYVNGRPVQSKAIEKALTDGYDGRIFSGFPIAVLFIEEDPFALDVNIHPGKREILFLHEANLSERIKEAVSEALSTSRSIPGLKAVESQDLQAEKKYFESAKSSEQGSIKDYLQSLSRADYSAEQEAKSEPETGSVHEQIEESEYNKAFDFSDLTLKGYVFDTYIITESGDNLYIFDQHAAHERIFYEKFIGVYNSEKKLSQELISPIMINISADLYLMKDEMLDSLCDLGYDISDFGAGTFIIRSIPSFMNASEARDFASAFCESFEGESAVNSTVIDKLIMKSCKSAVKGGDRLSDGEMKELLTELSSCKNPFSCPHGRPTFVKISKYDAERLFKRK